METRIYLKIKRNVPVPYGPKRNRNQMGPGNYLSDPDPDGWMLDGNPFWIFWEGADGSGDRELTVDETEVTIAGRTFRLSWFDEVAGVGKLLIVEGDFCAGQAEASAYCCAWNNMGSGSGPVTNRLRLMFGLPVAEAQEARPPVEPEAQSS